MVDTRRDESPKTIWAYGYRIAPPQAEADLLAIKALIEREHSNARLSARTWEARLVHDDRITHILVVSDCPEQNLEVNRALESALNKLKAGFSMTAPMAVPSSSSAPGAGAPG